MTVNIRTQRLGWWGWGRAGRDFYVDLGRYRFAKRGSWSPLFTEPRTFGPVQWWR